jgi:hypothetical protein
LRFGASEATFDGLDGDVGVSLTGQCVDLAEFGHALRVAKGRSAIWPTGRRVDGATKRSKRGSGVPDCT